MQALNAKELELRDRSRRWFPVLRRRVSRVWDIVSAWTWYQVQRWFGASSELYVPPKHLPPMRLRRRVNGLRDLHSYLACGRTCADDIERALASVGRPLSSFGEILDFGCGCGRTLMWLASRAPEASFTGTDVDAEAIAWCRAHLDRSRFDVNGAEPPLAYPDGGFDLVYVVSLFSHFSETAQEAWIDEVHRITAPGGIVLVTVHGEYVWEDFDDATLERLRTHGFAYYVHDPAGPPDFQTSYQSEAYVRERFARRFRVLAYHPRGLNRHQDVVVLEKP